jgi:hypothetical protein
MKATGSRSACAAIRRRQRCRKDDGAERLGGQKEGGLDLSSALIVRCWLIAVAFSIGESVAGANLEVARGRWVINATESRMVIVPERIPVIELPIDVNDGRPCHYVREAFWSHDSVMVDRCVPNIPGSERSKASLSVCDKGNVGKPVNVRRDFSEMKVDLSIQVQGWTSSRILELQKYISIRQQGSFASKNVRPLVGFNRRLQGLPLSIGDDRVNRGGYGYDSRESHHHPFGSNFGVFRTWIAGACFIAGWFSFIGVILSCVLIGRWSPLLRCVFGVTALGSAVAFIHYGIDLLYL